VTGTSVSDRRGVWRKGSVIPSIFWKLVNQCSDLTGCYPYCGSDHQCQCDDLVFLSQRLSCPSNHHCCVNAPTCSPFDPESAPVPSRVSETPSVISVPREYTRSCGRGHIEWRGSIYIHPRDALRESSKSARLLEIAHSESSRVAETADSSLHKVAWRSVFAREVGRPSMHRGQGTRNQVSEI
jgi:hypothetical protein